MNQLFLNKSFSIDSSHKIKHLSYTRVLLAISGGLDSICLLHWCCSQAEMLGLKKIIACHIHHGIRGLDADNDALFVKNLADQWKIPFIQKNIDGMQLIYKGNFESRARELRYEIFKQILKEENLEAVFTAHHTDDQAETLYMRMLRGTSLKGLQGILSERPDKIVRPFISVSRKNLLDYAKKNQLSWQEDSTNRDISYKRNFTRHHLLPNLKKEVPQISEKLSHIAALAQIIYPKIIKQAEAVFSSSLILPSQWSFPKRYSPYSKVLAFSQKSLEKALNLLGVGGFELLRLWLNEKGFRYPLDHFSRATSVSGWSFQKQQVEKSRYTIWFYDKGTLQNRDNLYYFKENLSFLGEWRHFRNGDRFSPPGFRCSNRKLTKWLQEHDVPHWVRRSLPSLVNNSEVYWIPGVVRSERFLNLKKTPL